MILRSLPPRPTEVSQWLRRATWLFGLGVTACDPVVTVGTLPVQPEAVESDAGRTRMDASFVHADASSDASSVRGDGSSVPMDASPAPTSDAAIASSGVVDGGTIVHDAGPLPEVGPRSRLPWLSGAHAGHEVTDYDAFERWRGRPVDLALFFVDRGNGWPGLVEPAWPVDMLGSLGARLVLAIPLFPESGGNRSDCAAGAYNDQWRKLGPFLAQRGRGDSIIRLGWGANDVGHPWGAEDDPGEYVRCFRQVVSALRGEGPELEIAWDFNAAGRPDNTGLDPLSAYPGDDYVDYVGIETFDQYPAATSRDAFRAACDAPTGLCTLIAFVRARGKRLGLSEWGVAGCGDGGGDNPLYIQLMHELFEQHHDAVGFELYYETGQPPCSMVSHADTSNPLAAERYRALFGR